MGEINLAIGGFYRFLLYDRSSFPQIHLHFKGKKQKRMRHTVSIQEGLVKKKRFLLMRLVTKEIISSMLLKNRSTNLLMLALEINSSLICS